MGENKKIAFHYQAKGDVMEVYLVAQYENFGGQLNSFRTIRIIKTIRTIKTITRSGITLWFRPLVFLSATILIVLIVLKVSIVSFF